MNEIFNQHVDGIKRRWPAIGRRLDHPLAEAIFAEVQRQSKTALLKKCLKTCFWVTVAIGAFYAIVYASFNTIRSNVIMNGVIAWIVVVSQSIARLREQGPIKLFLNKNSWSLRDIWLTGIGYDEMLAIWIMLRVYRSHPWRRFFVVSILLFVIFMAIVWDITRMQAFTIHMWVLVVAAFMFLQAVYYCVTHPNTVAIRAMKRFSLVVGGRHGPVNALMQLIVIGLVLFVLFFGCFIFLFLIIMSMRPLLSGISTSVLLTVIALILLGASGLLVYFANHTQARRARFKFVESCHRERKFFSEIIYAESELPDVK